MTPADPKARHVQRMEKNPQFIPRGLGFLLNAPSWAPTGLQSADQALPGNWEGDHGRFQRPKQAEAVVLPVTE